jgi:hypothetical protein
MTNNYKINVFKIVGIVIVFAKILFTFIVFFIT